MNIRHEAVLSAVPRLESGLSLNIQFKILKERQDVGHSAELCGAADGAAAAAAAASETALAKPVNHFGVAATVIKFRLHIRSMPLLTTPDDFARLARCGNLAKNKAPSWRSCSAYSSKAFHRRLITRRINSRTHHPSQALRAAN